MAILPTLSELSDSVGIAHKRSSRWSARSKRDAHPTNSEEIETWLMSKLC
jgi:hypothetical protein